MSKNFLTQWFKEQENKRDFIKANAIYATLIARSKFIKSIAEPPQDTWNIRDFEKHYSLSESVKLKGKKILDTSSKDHYVFDANTTIFPNAFKGHAHQLDLKVRGIILSTIDRHVIGVITNATNLNCEINGGDIIITWSNGDNRIFSFDD